LSFYITTPLYYVNDLPHIGSAYPTIVTDFFAGHFLQRGQEVGFLTGTDEHGQKIEKAAAKYSKSPKSHCDYIAGEFLNLWDKLDIRFDYFRRTSQEDHHKFVTDFFNKVEANGDIYKGIYKGLYCLSCEDFKSEKELEEIEINGEKKLLCPIHKQPVEKYEQENYFFRLSKFENQLKAYIEEHPDFISPEYRKNEVLVWIKEGLRDFPVSRVGINWGIAVPIDHSEQPQIIYVWFDALLGYISGLGEDQSKYWNNHSQSQIVHIIGKDILRFHAVFWPAMLMSAGFPLPTKVFGHGFLTKDGMKMGKTLGNIIDPIQLINDYGSDAVRFYFTKEIVFGKDGDFNEENFVKIVNADLANNLGNLLSRAIKLTNKYFGKSIPDSRINRDIEEEWNELKIKFENNMEKLNPTQALDDLFIVLNKVNALVNDVAPWKILKENPNDQLAIDCLFTALESCRKAGLYLAALCPSLSIKIFLNLGLVDESLSESDLQKSSFRKELLKNIFSWSKLDKQEKFLNISSDPQPIFERLNKSVSI
jgi:methionyl-tRNA synthetase